MLPTALASTREIPEGSKDRRREAEDLEETEEVDNDFPVASASALILFLLLWVLCSTHSRLLFMLSCNFSRQADGEVTVVEF